MAHFAEIDKNNVVVRVLVTDNELPNEGYDWLVKTFGGRWVQTSYNTRAGVHLLGGTPVRKNYAGIGFSYDESKDAFIPPKVFESWVLNEQTALWESPIPMPEDASKKPDDGGKIYRWNESIVNWELVETEEQ